MPDSSLPSGSWARRAAGTALGVLLSVSAPAGAQCVPVGQPCLPPGGFRAGFGPLVLAGGGSSRGGHPVVADLGLTPGQKSIVFGTANGRLYVVKHDGTVAPGFPVTLPREIVSSPAVGTVTRPNGSTAIAIVVGFGSGFQGQQDAGGVRAYLNDGTLLWERLTSAFIGSSAPVVSAPAIGDIDDDGRSDVVFTSFDERVYAVEGGTGALKQGWPHQTYDTIWSSPALADLDGDGKLEVIVGSDQHFEPAPLGTPDGGGLHVIRWDGARFPGFPRYYDQVIASSPAVGDIDGNGRPEIVFGTGSFWPDRQHKVRALRCDGTPVPGWPVTVLGQVSTSPALADLNGDGVPEVIVTDDNTGTDGLRRCYAFRGNGSALFAPVVIRDYFGANLSAGDPVVGDVLGDPAPEILVPTNGEICVISSTGVQLTDDGSHPAGGFTFGAAAPLFNATVAELDPGSSEIEVVAVAGAPTAGAIGVWIWNPKAPSLPVPWGMFHANEARTGLVPGTPSCAPLPGLGFRVLEPCRIIDTRWADVPVFGGPPLAARETRPYELAGRCSIPASARALAVNATVVNPGTNGAITLSPGDLTVVPSANALAFRPGLTRACHSIIRLSSDSKGRLRVSNASDGTAHFILDVSGYFE